MILCVFHFIFGLLRRLQTYIFSGLLNFFSLDLLGLNTQERDVVSRKFSLFKKVRMSACSFKNDFIFHYIPSFLNISSVPSQRMRFLFISVSLKTFSVVLLGITTLKGNPFLNLI